MHNNVICILRFFNNTYILSKIKYIIVVHYYIYIDTRNIFITYTKLSITNSEINIVHCMNVCNFACQILEAPGTHGEE